MARLPAPFIGSDVVLSNNNRVVSEEETEHTSTTKDVEKVAD